MFFLVCSVTGNLCASVYLLGAICKMAKWRCLTVAGAPAWIDLTPHPQTCSFNIFPLKANGSLVLPCSCFLYWSLTLTFTPTWTPAKSICSTFETPRMWPLLPPPRLPLWTEHPHLPPGDRSSHLAAPSACVSPPTVCSWKSSQRQGIYSLLCSVLQVFPSSSE